MSFTWLPPDKFVTVWEEFDYDMDVHIKFCQLYLFIFSSSYSTIFYVLCSVLSTLNNQLT